MSDASRRLIGWELRSDMQGHRCSYCEQDAGLHRQCTSIQLLNHIERRLRQMAQILAVGLFLLISVVMSILIVVLLGGRIQSPDSQRTGSLKQDFPVALEQQKPEDLKHPSAMLTAPRNHNNYGRYLQWENTYGIADCQGFTYSGGNLTVLRDGTYSVALQITLVSDRGQCDEESLRMSVLYCEKDYEMFVPLLVSYGSMSCKNACRKSFFTQATFHLKAASVLRVEAFHPEHIKRSEDEHEVFFNVHHLSE